MIIVIGGSGFIGLYTVEALLRAGKDVIVTGRSEASKNYFEAQGVQYINLNIENEADFGKLPNENVEGVIFLAGLLPANSNINIEIEENASDYIKINTLGTTHALEYCRKNNIKKFITTTSYADVSNSWGNETPISEKEPRGYKLSGDHAAYIISKNAASDMVEYYNNQHGMQGSIFRLPPVYGVGPHSEIYVNGKYYKSGIQTFIEKAQKGEDIEIWGNSKISRDIIYVKDVATAFIKILKSNTAKGLYNMTSGKSVTLEEQVETVIALFSLEDKKSKIIYRSDLKNHTPSFLFSMEKAKKDFDFIPVFTDFYDMMLDYKNELDSQRFSWFVRSRVKDKVR